MAVYGKKLLDMSGNVILPKTRSSLVYMDENNATVQETIEDILKKINAIGVWNKITVGISQNITIPTNPTILPEKMTLDAPFTGRYIIFIEGAIVSDTTDKESKVNLEVGTKNSTGDFSANGATSCYVQKGNFDSIIQFSFPYFAQNTGANDFYVKITASASTVKLSYISAIAIYFGPSNLNP